jgi:Arc/MetJ family transcription regulator
MATNLAIDNELLDTALKVGGLKSKKDTVNKALSEFIKRRKTSDIIEMFGKVEYDADYDYKEGRQKRT